MAGGRGACMAGGACVARVACMAGGMHRRRACMAGGFAWQGACMAGGAWQGACMAGGTHDPPQQIPRDMVNERAVRILLECTLVFFIKVFRFVHLR